VARALVGVAQLGRNPAVFAVVAGSMERGSLQANIFAGGHVRAGRQNVTDRAVQNTVHVDDALRAAVGLPERGRHLAAVNTFADGVQRGPLHLDVLAGFGIWAGRLCPRTAFPITRNTGARRGPLSVRASQ